MARPDAAASSPAKSAIKSSAPRVERQASPSSDAKCQAPLLGEDSQISRFGPCLLTIYVPPSGSSICRMPPVISTSSQSPSWSST